MILTKKDVISTLITGLTAGAIASQIFSFLNLEPVFGIPWVALIAIVPVLWMGGVQLGYILGRWFLFFNQFGKFVAIGFTNAIIDFGILNLLISTSSITEDSTLVVFKGIAFLVAATHSYFWNKTWVFQSLGSVKPMEIGKFLTVNLGSLLINTLVFSLVYAAGNTESILEATRWANVAAVVGSASALIFSFVGFKLLVFHR